jgi:hypothetical protein
VRYSIKVNGFEKSHGELPKEEIIELAKSFIPTKEACISFLKIDCSVIERYKKRETNIIATQIIPRGYGTSVGEIIWQKTGIII